MSELKVGNEYKMKFPFKKIIHKAQRAIFNFPATDEFIMWNAGCWLFEEEDGSEYGRSRDFYGNAEGEVIYKILSIAKMSGRHMDRVIFKRWLVDPDGKKCNNGSVTMKTINLFKRDIESESPFNADYEIDEDAKN
ncbi:MAG: hypothetical protein MJK15_03910 [Colwellia sp.]|nr:hypothetical protein [Colwellia sp.]